MSSISANLEAALNQLDSGPVWVAFSGGLDSTVLLHGLLQLNSLRSPRSIVAVHVNHQLSPHAADWEKHCWQLCADWGVSLKVESVTVAEVGRGLEDAAREARYRVFADCLSDGGTLLTGHHADDQMETLLLRLLRGSGPRGLAAMAQSRALGGGCLRRPLLSVRRSELEEYARQHQLSWIEDESNLELRFDRNYLRHQVLPALQKRWPEGHKRWQQSIELCAESEALLEDLAGQDLESADERSEWGGASLELPVLQSLSRPRRHNLLRHWLRKLDLPLPSAQQLVEIDTQLVEGREDAQAQVCWQRLTSRRFRERLYILQATQLMEGSASRANIGIDLQWPASKSPLELPLPNGGRMYMHYSPSGETGERLRADLPDLQLRWRQGGERCQPSGRQHSQTLKRLLQETGLEPWWRAHLPLVYSGEQLVAAGDLWICRGYVAAPDEPGYLLEWLPAGGKPSAGWASFD